MKPSDFKQSLSKIFLQKSITKSFNPIINSIRGHPPSSIVVFIFFFFFFFFLDLVVFIFKC